MSTKIADGTSEFSQWVKETARLAQEEVKKEIALHKAAGNPIFYSRNGKLVMELADGRCYEYRRQEDGTREIIQELPPRC
ncbi:MmgE/PrpD family protein [Chroococcidiopsis sp. CCALA 051]|uniref:MmgE/PrpD family protein n=1 Tax=Chroococcidiopsis sp. CCALA 051 TaxID=869949 RepID=UPI000D0D0255|nr:MmgE/PrpD family protein [Chroococcidiopsis sp. CCALA 051]MBE9020006.1 MmgE/PrpD family protein [Chroococcidiopsidales cyanobacterium LEGE 13417]PSM48458.1 MmgE/PrpD family protein [Chroococcidiopsis sp. CCALA 051]